MTYDKDPQKTLEFLRNKLGVNFGHQKEELGVEPNLPTSLNPQQITRAALMPDQSPPLDLPSRVSYIAKSGKPDWIGFTDIYWMSTLIPEKVGASGDFARSG